MCVSFRSKVVLIYIQFSALNVFSVAVVCSVLTFKNVVIEAIYCLASEFLFAYSISFMHCFTNSSA